MKELRRVMEVDTSWHTLTKRFVPSKLESSRYVFIRDDSIRLSLSATEAYLRLSAALLSTSLSKSMLARSKFPSIAKNSPSSQHLRPYKALILQL